MPTIDEVREQIGSLTRVRAVLAHPEIAELPKILGASERIEAVVQGWFEDDPGLLVATDSRVLFVQKGFVYGLKVEEFAYDKLSAVRSDSGLLMATITLLAAGVEADITRVPGNEAQPFCAVVRAHLNGGGGPPPPLPSNGNGNGAPSNALSGAADGDFLVVPPTALPSFADVGGMDGIKAELKQTFGLVLAYAAEAEAYKVSWNGVLLDGPPGVGKTFLARALAGEFALNFIEVGPSEITAAARGASAQNVVQAFEAASRHLPCVLFFDEFDALARNRADTPDPEARATLDELLRRLEEYRSVRDLVVVAATNSVGDLDPAVVRAGRFDKHVHVDLPDAAARSAIFSAALAGRPAAADIDTQALAERSSGLTAAAVAQIVDAAALAALEAHAPLTQESLLAALANRGGDDRPTVEDWSWGRLVLPDAVERELRAILSLLEDPERALQIGIDLPSGLLLTGPPGTGKTTIAKVFAAQARCSFYPVSGADVTSKWAGESEQRIQRLFARAREAAPSIVFLDEVDALAGTRGNDLDGGSDRQLDQLLQEMDGLGGRHGVFVLAATNRPDQVDPALLRGGRLSRTLEIPLPDLEGRRALLAQLTAKMPLAGVDLDALAAETDASSGADLNALCQQAALAALVRAGDDGDTKITREDFEHATAELRR